jgi:hypothetical protein
MKTRRKGTSRKGRREKRPVPRVGSIPSGVCNLCVLFALLVLAFGPFRRVVP